MLYLNLEISLRVLMVVAVVVLLILRQAFARYQTGLNTIAAFRDDIPSAISHDFCGVVYRAWPLKLSLSD